MRSTVPILKFERAREPLPFACGWHLEYFRTAVAGRAATARQPSTALPRRDRRCDPQYTIICCLNLSYVTTQDYHQKRDHLALLCVLSTIYLAYVSTIVAKGCYYHAGPFCALSTADLARDIALANGVH